MTTGYRHSRRRSRGTGEDGFEELTALPEVSSWWQRALAPPDPLHQDAGAEGELLVARVRILLIILLLPVPVINLMLDPNLTGGMVGLFTCLVALFLAFGADWLLRSDFYRPWLGLATSLLDVTLVSAGHAAFLVLDQPMPVVNNRLLFDVYFLAIGATAFRYDARVTFAAGLAAVVEYLTLVLYAARHWDLYAPALAAAGYGPFDWATQGSRVVMLGVMTLLSAGLVRRSQGLRRQSRSDRLTGLPNRSYFDERVEAELSRARRREEPVALAMIDIDHFKEFNDRWGHAAGDAALRDVAHAILSATRQSDLVVRYGGEEFVALFPAMDTAAAMQRAEAIRTLVEQLPIPIPRRHEVDRVTISIGIATYGRDGTAAEDLMDRADARLFLAKQGGRNRVIGPGPEAPVRWKPGAQPGPPAP